MPFASVLARSKTQPQPKFELGSLSPFSKTITVMLRVPSENVFSFQQLNTFILINSAAQARKQFAGFSSKHDQKRKEFPCLKL